MTLTVVSVSSVCFFYFPFVVVMVVAVPLPRMRSAASILGMIDAAESFFIQSIKLFNDDQTNYESSLSLTADCPTTLHTERVRNRYPHPHFLLILSIMIYKMTREICRFCNDEGTTVVFVYLDHLSNDRSWLGGRDHIGQDALSARLGSRQ